MGFIMKIDMTGTSNRCIICICVINIVCTNFCGCWEHFPDLRNGLTKSFWILFCHK